MKNKKRGRKLGTKNKDKLKIQLKFIVPEKAELIKLIWSLQPNYKELNIDLRKYTLGELQKHIDLVKIKRKKRKKKGKK